MEPYRDWDHDSGVCAYEIGDGYITVEFRSGKNKFCKYTNLSAGAGNISQMQRLARLGDGLNEYIVENKVKYQSKW